MVAAAKRKSQHAKLPVPRIRLNRDSPVGLRDQVQSEISRLISTGAIALGARLPSCRQLAQDLGVSINRVLGAYSRLCDDKLIASRPRAGYFVCDELRIPVNAADDGDDTGPAKADILGRIGRRQPSRGTYILRPPNWQEFRYPFVCNQIDTGRFPIAEWRECTRLAMNRRDLGIWSSDNQYWDAPELLDQICNRLLPRRGLTARSQNVLVTLGAQQGLYLVASLLRGAGRVVAMEDPGYPDARNIFAQLFDEVRFIPVDAEGIVVDDRLRGADLVYVTPNRQFPTTVSLSQARRRALLALAEAEDFLIIEDDYDCDVDFRTSPPLPLYQIDRSARVIYTTSLSKSLAPGLRLGFLVAPEELVTEARALRGMMIRHPPLVLQHTAALFLRLGHYDALCSRLHAAFERRWSIAGAALARDFSDFGIVGATGGTNFMLNDPTRQRSGAGIVRRALDAGVVVEAVEPCFFTGKEGGFAFRLGFSSVPAADIEPGLAVLRGVIDDL